MKEINYVFRPVQEESKLTLVDICDTTVVNVKPVECPLRIVLLDVGITSSLSAHHKQTFSDVFRAVVLGDVSKFTDNGGLLLVT